MNTKPDMNMAMKAVGMTMAVGTAAAMASTMVHMSSPKYKAKKMVKKASKAFSGIVDGVQHMVK